MTHFPMKILAQFRDPCDIIDFSPPDKLEYHGIKGKRSKTDRKVGQRAEKSINFRIKDFHII